MHSVAQWSEHLPSKQCVVGSNPTRAALFSFLRKKELFMLVVLPCFIFIGLRVFMNNHMHRAPPGPPRHK